MTMCLCEYACECIEKIMHVCVHIYICVCVGVCMCLVTGMPMFACVGW